MLCSLFLLVALLSRAYAANLAVFPDNISRERIVKNTAYPGFCTTSSGQTSKRIATFKLRVDKHSENIINRGFNSTSHIGIQLLNSNPQSSAPNNTSMPFITVSFGSTQFGGSAAKFLYQPKPPIPFQLSADGAYYIFNHDFVGVEYTATRIMKTWYDLADSKIQAHWPRYNGKPLGPRPAERFIVVVSLGASLGLTNGTSVSEFESKMNNTYNKVLEDFKLTPNIDALGTNTLCTVSIFIDYDVNWSTWALVVSLLTSAIAITLVSVFKCCPCASVKRLYGKRAAEKADSEEVFTAEPTGAPSNISLSAETIKLEIDSTCDDLQKQGFS